MGYPDIYPIHFASRCWARAAFGSTKCSFGADSNTHIRMYNWKNIDLRFVLEDNFSWMVFSHMLESCISIGLHTL